MDSTEICHPESLWYAFLDSRAKGPFDENLLRQMHAAGVIQANTPVAMAGTQEWKPFEKTFPLLEFRVPPKKTVHPPSNDSGGYEPNGIASLAAKAVTAIRTTRFARMAVIVALVIFASLGLKIHAKIERERQGREFRQKAIADPLDGPARPYFAGNAVHRCPRCQGTGLVKRTSFPSPGTDWASNDPGRCRACGGQGTFLSPSGREVECKECNGRGFSPEVPCGMCNGRGTVSE